MDGTTSASSSRRLLVALVVLVASGVGFTGLTVSATGQEATPTGAATPTAVDPCETLLATAEAAASTTPVVGTPEALTIDQVPFDLLFLDAMIRHHAGGITMADVVRARSERPELREFAQQMITAQQAEIAQLEAWRDAWYPDAGAVPEQFQVALMDEGRAVAGGTADVGMGNSTPGLPSPTTNAIKLCQIDDPTTFDLRYIEMQITHHQSAIGMGILAGERADHPEIKEFAQHLIAVETEEIGQLAVWRDQWTGLSAGSATPAA